MTKKIIHFGDLHIGSGEQYGKIDPKTGQNTRFLDFCSALDQVLQGAIDSKADLVVFAGDAFKTRQPTTTQQKAFATRLKTLSELKIPTLLLVGNHDQHADPNKANTLESIATLADENFVRVSKTPELIEMNGIQIATLPWINRSTALNNGDFDGLTREEINAKMSEMASNIVQTLIKQADETKPLIIVAHATVSGATFGAERSVMLGQDLVIPHTAFLDEKISYVALGHIHRHQTVGEDYIVYSGSPERLDFGEANEPKGYVLANVEAGKRAKWKFKETKAREFIKIEVDSTITDISKTKKPVEITDIEGKIVKIIVRGHKSDIDDFDFEVFEKRQLEKKPHFLQIIKEIIKNDRETVEAENYSEMSPADILDKFLTRKKFKVTDKTKILSKSKKIIENLDTEKSGHAHGGFIPVKLNLQNFTSHENSTLDFDKISLAVLTGENGAGKSSLIEAIAWVIWGESRSKSDDNLVRQGTDSMEVSFEFKVGDDGFKIIRKRTVKGKRGTATLELQNKSGKKWQTISGSTIKETQEKIVQVIGMSFEVFSNSAFLRQGKSGDFTSATPSQRKEILAEILTLGIWSEIEAQAKEGKKEIESKTLISEGKIEQLQNVVNEEAKAKREYEESLEDLEYTKTREKRGKEDIEKLEAETKSFDSIEEKRVFYQEGLRKNEQRFNEIKAEIREIDQNIEGNQKIIKNDKKIREASEKLPKIQTELNDLEKLKEKFLDVKTEIQRKENEKIFAEDRIKALDQEKKEIQKRGKTLAEKLTAEIKDCPTCGASVEHQKRDSHAALKKEQDDLRTKWHEKDKSQKSLQEQLSKIVIPELPTYSEIYYQQTKGKYNEVKKVADMLPHLESAEEKIRYYQEKKSKLNIEELELFKSTDEYESKLKELPEVDKEKIEQLKKLKIEQEGIEETKSKRQSLLAICENNLKRIDDAKKEIKEIKKENKTLLSDKLIFELLAESCGKKGAPAMIIESVLPEIEEEANTILKRISSGKMQVRFSSVRDKKSASKKEMETSGSQIETLDIYVSDEQGEREFEMFSGGEAFRVNFAIRVALSKILAKRAGTQIKFLLIDEGFGVLDGEGRAAFISAVQAVADDFEKVISITHIEEIKDAFDTQIFIEKSNNISNVLIK